MVKRMSDKRIEAQSIPYTYVNEEGRLVTARIPTELVEWIKKSLDENAEAMKKLAEL